MHCRTCGTALERPGDWCLVCDSGPTVAVVCELDQERTTVTMVDDDEVVGETTITTVPDEGERVRELQVRNYVERIAGEIHRKRPKGAYVAGDRELIRRLRGELAAPVYRIDDEDPVATYLATRDGEPLEVVERPVAAKLGGRHSSVIGDRRGRSALRLLADHPHVKKIIPGPIDASGTGSRSGFRVKVTRPDTTGNLRALLRDGSSVQEVRIVTTARDRDQGERIGDELNEHLRSADAFG